MSAGDMTISTSFITFLNVCTRREKISGRAWHTFQKEVQIGLFLTSQGVIMAYILYVVAAVGAAAGAGAGAMIGLAGGPVGALVGAAIGGTIGGIGGYFGSKALKKKRKN